MLRTRAPVEAAGTVRRPTATLVAVVRVLDENGIVPDDIGLRNPTLDDVFLALTGEPTDADAEANA